MRNPLNKTIWCDMDGVLAIYEHDAYMAPPGKTPKWLTPNLHYYRDLKPEPHALKLLDYLWRHDYQVQIITNITDKPIGREHETDKKIWLQTWMPFIDLRTNFHAIHTPKIRYAREYIRQPLLPSDILISDFNHDLIPWTEEGGTAFKYLNGLNSPDSYQGPHITREQPPEQVKQAMDQLYKLAS